MTAAGLDENGGHRFEGKQLAVQFNLPFDQRGGVAYGEGRNVVAIPQEQSVAQLMLGGQHDLARVIVPRRKLLKHRSALPERQFPLMRAQR